MELIGYWLDVGYCILFLATSNLHSFGWHQPHRPWADEVSRPGGLDSFSAVQWDYDSQRLGRCGNFGEFDPVCYGKSLEFPERNGCFNGKTFIIHTYIYNHSISIYLILSYPILSYPILSIYLYLYIYIQLYTHKWVISSGNIFDVALGAIARFHDSRMKCVCFPQQNWEEYHQSNRRNITKDHVDYTMAYNFAGLTLFGTAWHGYTAMVMVQTITVRPRECLGNPTPDGKTSGKQCRCTYDTSQDAALHNTI